MFRHALLERNASVIAALRGLEYVYQVDLTEAQLPALQAQAAILDPPWYPGDTHAFLVATSTVCAIGARIVLCQPTLATRPGVAEERAALLDELPRLGFACREVEAARVRYHMPHFEASSLRIVAPDLIVPDDWRVGDMLILEKISDATLALREAVLSESWQEVAFGPVRIKLRRTEAPDLGSLVPGDILDTVSRRDPIRKRIGLWTSGNRVFSLESVEAIGSFIGLCHTDIVESIFTLKRLIAHARITGVSMTCRVQAFRSATDGITRAHATKGSFGSMSEVRIIQQIASAADVHDNWKQLELFTDESSATGLHIACMVEPFLSYILEGRKTIESRFSKPLIAPYRRIAIGDVVLLKAGPIVASFRAASVEFIPLNDREFNRLMKNYSEAICADAAFWRDRADECYATLLGISDVRQLTALKVDKHDRRGWMVLRDSLASPATPRQLSLV